MHLVVLRELVVGPELVVEPELVVGPELVVEPKLINCFDLVARSRACAVNLKTYNRAASSSFHVQYKSMRRWSQKTFSVCTQANEQMTYR